MVEPGLELNRVRDEGSLSVCNRPVLVNGPPSDTTHVQTRLPPSVRRHYGTDGRQAEGAGHWVSFKVSLGSPPI